MGSPIAPWLATRPSTYHKVLGKAKDAAEAAHGDDLPGQVKDLQRLTMGMPAVGQARANLEPIGPLVALATYPEARVAVSERLVTFDGGASHGR